jgi:hypothetical protein
MRRAAALVVATVAAAAGLLAASPERGAAAPTASQAFFTQRLLDDARTTASVRRLLRGGGGFVAPAVQFSDVTGDGRPDALVRVETGGAAGTVAVYLLTTHGRDGDELRVVFRSQRLHRASAVASGSSLVLRTPRWRAGDNLCCPSRVLERVYAWSARSGTLVRRSSRTVPGPVRGAG